MVCVVVVCGDVKMFAGSEGEDGPIVYCPACALSCGCNLRRCLTMSNRR